jgi:hypothetical protein
MKAEDGNVVSIETRFSEAAPVELLQQRYDACRHEHTWLDEKLRLVGCSDCGEERLDAFEVLVHLAKTWRSWKREAENVRRVNAEYHANLRATWERARERHLGAHPEHLPRHFVTQADGSVVPHEYIAAMEYNMRRTPSSYGYAVKIPDDCRACGRLVMQFDSRWIVRSAPEPPPGKLDFKPAFMPGERPDGAS